MKWLLDTNVVSEPIRPRPDANVLGWIESQHPGELAISIITSAELRDGASTHVDQARRKQLTDWIETTISEQFRDRTLPLTMAILIDWIKLGRHLRSQRISREPSDLLIASTARVHNLVVVTRNVKDFTGTGVMLYDPWAGKTHHMDTP